jgi:O-antigen/teichoic acid export membrane protein
MKEYLGGIAKGTGIQIAGNIGAKLLIFISAILVIRYLTPSQWGVLSLCLVLLEISIVISGLGLQRGVARFIAFNRAKKSSEKIWGTIISSLAITIIIGVSAFSALYLLSANIANFFKAPELTTVIKWMAITVPAMNLINVLASVFQGFEKVEVHALFSKIFFALTKLIIIGVIISLGLSFKGVISAYVISPLLILFVLIFYSVYKLPKLLPFRGYSFNAIELIRFSFPILATALLWIIMQRIDLLMVGYFLPEENIGQFSAVFRLNEFLPFILTSASFIYLPIATRMMSNKEEDNLSRIYSALTKWCYIASLPLLLAFIVFPHYVMPLLFGSSYAYAALTLRILSLGYLVHILAGLNGTTIIAAGKTWILFTNSIIALIINFILNWIFIPKFGINGAALATAISYIFINLVYSSEIFQLWRLHPFTKSYIKVLAGTFMLALALYTVFNLLQFALIIKIILSISILFIFVFIYLIFIKWFEDEDIILLEIVAEKLKLNTDLINKINNKLKIQ